MATWAWKMLLHIKHPQGLFKILATNKKIVEILKHISSLKIVGVILLPETPSALTTLWQSIMCVSIIASEQYQWLKPSYPSLQNYKITMYTIYSAQVIRLQSYVIVWANFTKKKNDPECSLNLFKSTIYERGICCSNSSIVVFPPPNSNGCHRVCIFPDYTMPCALTQLPTPT